MGLKKKHEVRGVSDPAKRSIWVLAEIPLMNIKTKASSDNNFKEEEAVDENYTLQLTPRGREAAVPEMFLCPPAPKKPKPSLRCRHIGEIQFFSPPDLESVFIPRAQRVK